MPEQTIDIRSARHTILHAALAAVDARRQRRLTARVVVVLAILGAATWFATGRDHLAIPTAPPQIAPITASTGVGPPLPHTPIVYLTDDRDILVRCRAVVSLAPGAIVANRPIDASIVIDDAELLRWLHRAGHRSGYVRSGDHFELTRPLGE